MNSTETHPPLEKYVLSAVRAVGYKAADLDEDQRQRAQTAGQVHPGLRGKALGRYIIEGVGLAEQERQAESERLLNEANQASQNRSEAAKAAGTRPPAPVQTSSHTPEEDALIAATQGLVKNTKNEKYGTDISPEEVLTYKRTIDATPDFMEGYTREQLIRISNGLDRVPRSVSTRWSGPMYEHIDKQVGKEKPSWHFMKGIIAVAVASGYEPPAAPEPVIDENVRYDSVASRDQQQQASNGEAS